MKRARKSNRVSWAPGPNLCQLRKKPGIRVPTIETNNNSKQRVKLFLSEDYPSKVGLKSQDHLQANTLSMLPSSGNECEDLPPGFEGNHFLDQSRAELSHISQIKWECPPLIALSDDWCVAAGEESREKDYQKLREMRVLEAVYPRLSSIPPSPSVSLEVKEEHYDDNLTAVIPIIPIEEEESMDIIKPEVAATKLVETPTILKSQNLPQYIPAATSQCKPSSSSVLSSARGKPVPGVSPCVEADLAAASAVIAAIIQSNEQGSMIDTDLLLKIFNDPTIIGKLINQHGTAATTTVNVSSNISGKPTSELKSVGSSVPLSKPTPEVAVSARTTPTTAVGLVPASGPKQATPTQSLLTPTPDKPPISSVSVLTSTFDKPATPSVPLFRPVSVSLPPPPPSYTPVPHMSNGVLPNFNTHSRQEDTILLSGLKRPASLAFVSSSELSTVALPSANGNLHAVTNQVRSNASTVPYQQGTGTASAVKDANYYKNLIWQHGSDKQNMQDSQIGIHHNNFQDLKPVHNITNPGEVIFKTQKPCIYFKSSRGCRNGSNCPYEHDMSVQFGASNVLGAPNAKRVKLGAEIKGWI